MTDRTPLPELSEYVDHVRHHWLRLTVTALIGALIGTAVYLAMPDHYTATSRVALSPQLTFLSLNTDSEKQRLVTLDTTAMLLRSDAALERMARVMGVSPSEADDRLVISAKPGSRVLVLQVTGDTRKQAVAGANSATESLLQLQADTFALSRDRVGLLKNRVAVLQAQAQEQIAEGAPSQALFETVDILQRRLDNAIATNNTDSAVIVRAQVFKFQPGQVEVFVLGGLTLALLAGLISTMVNRRRH